MEMRSWTRLTCRLRPKQPVMLKKSCSDRERSCNSENTNTIYLYSFNSNLHYLHASGGVSPSSTGAHFTKLYVKHHHWSTEVSILWDSPQAPWLRIILHAKGFTTIVSLDDLKSCALFQMKVACTGHLDAMSIAGCTFLLLIKGLQCLLIYNHCWSSHILPLHCNQCADLWFRSIDLL